MSYRPLLDYGREGSGECVPVTSSLLISTPDPRENSFHRSIVAEIGRRPDCLLPVARLVVCGAYSGQAKTSDTPDRAFPAWVKTTRTFVVFTLANFASFHCPPAARAGVCFSSCTGFQPVPSQYSTT